MQDPFAAHERPAGQRYSVRRCLPGRPRLAHGELRDAVLLEQSAEIPALRAADAGRRRYVAVGLLDEAPQEAGLEFLDGLVLGEPQVQLRVSTRRAGGETGSRRRDRDLRAIRQQDFPEDEG